MTKHNRSIFATDQLKMQSMVFLLIAAILLVPDLLILPGFAQAQPSSPIPAFVGRVCIVGGDSTDCPQNLPAIIVPPGLRLNVSMNILGSTTFNAFNISVRWDPTIVNATSVDLTGTLLPSPTILTQCVNGSGSRCGPLDGPGVAHIAVTGANVSAPATGRLFKIPFFASVSRVAIPIGFQTGCSNTSVPNTNLCLSVATGPSTNPGSITVPEGIQSQLLGTQLPTPLHSVTPSGNITNNFGGGIGPSFADTYLMPYTINLPGNITTWKVQFTNGLTGGTTGSPVVPKGVELKVLRRTNATTLTVIAAGLVHDPRGTLQARVPGYPFMTTEQTVIEYFSDPGIAVLPGDIIGFTILADPSVGEFVYPAVNGTLTRYVQSNLNGSISLFDKSILILADNITPVLQVFIHVPPPPTDTAGDGISDFVKLSPEMLPLGADPCRKTVAVQLDYMVRPNQTAINIVIASFDAAPVNVILACPYPGYPLKSCGIKLIIDVRNQIPFQGVLNFTHTGPLSFDSVKAQFLDPNRARYFHYGIFAHDLAPQDSTSGVGEIYGGNFMVTLGEWPNGGSAKEQAGTLMHELGHNLGLDHGGDSAINFKANYLSVMNYAFQVVGITTETSSGTLTRFDFSSQTLPPLNESSLAETTRLTSSSDITRWACPDGRHVDFGVVSGPLDFNCNGLTDNVKVSADINNDTKLETLTGFNDWARLRYNFTRSQAFGVGCASGCDIGCHSGCDIGTELTYAQAVVIETQWNTFLATPHRPTSTSINCPATVPVNSPSKCTATVTDTSSTAPLTPTGTITFTSSQKGSFAPSEMCTLSGTGASSSCSVTYTPSSLSLGPQTLSAFYPGTTSHLASSDSTTVVGILESIKVSEFFTDSSLTSLPLDANGNPNVDVVLARGIVASTIPGQVLVWVNVTNTGATPLQSVKLNETLPVDWTISPPWLPGAGTIHVYYANTSSLATNPEITQPSTITVTTGNPQTVILAIPNLNATRIGHPLMPGQSILLSVKLSYGLVRTSQSVTSYPRNYSDTATAAALSQPFYTGTEASATGSALFIAGAKVVGTSKVSIV